MALTTKLIKEICIMRIYYKKLFQEPKISNAGFNKKAIEMGQMLRASFSLMLTFETRNKQKI